MTVRKPREYILLSFNTNIDTKPWDVGSKILETIFDFSPLLVPELFDNDTDTLRKPYQGIDETASFWAPRATLRALGMTFTYAQTFSWRRRKKIAYRGDLTHSDWKGKEPRWQRTRSAQSGSTRRRYRHSRPAYRGTGPDALSLAPVGGLWAQSRSMDRLPGKAAHPLRPQRGRRYRA